MWGSMLLKGRHRRVGVKLEPASRMSHSSDAEHRRGHDQHDLPFPLLVDEDHAVAEAYGAWGKKKMYGKTYEGIIRSTFLIGADGMVARTWSGVKVKGHVDEVMEELEQI